MKKEFGVTTERHLKTLTHMTDSVNILLGVCLETATAIFGLEHKTADYIAMMAKHLQPFHNRPRHLNNIALAYINIAASMAGRCKIWL